MSLQSPLATCPELERELVNIRKQLELANANPSQEARNFRDRVIANRALWRRALEDLKVAERKALINAQFAGLSLGFGAVLLGLGLALPSAPVIGTIAAVQLVGGLGLWAWQMMRTEETSAVSALVGYGANRTLLLGEIIGDHARSKAGRLVADVLGGASLTIDALSAWSTRNQLGSARDKVALATERLRRIEEAFDFFERERAAWMSLHKGTLTSAERWLRQYIEATRVNGCVITGPVLVPR